MIVRRALTPLQREYLETVKESAESLLGLLNGILDFSKVESGKLELEKQPFSDPDPFHELAFASAIDAKRAIADRLGMPLAKLTSEQLAALNALLAETLAKPVVWDHVRRHLDPLYRG